MFRDVNIVVRMVSLSFVEDVAVAVGDSKGFRMEDISDMSLLRELTVSIVFLAIKKRKMSITQRIDYNY